MIKKAFCLLLSLFLLHFASNSRHSSRNLNPIYKESLWTQSSIYSPLMVYDININRQEKPVLDTFAATYFSNLSENIGFNTNGTCPYVAVGMLLSFYDTYLNNNVIDDTYIQKSIVELGAEYTLISRDTPSPGIISEPLVDVTNLTWNQYKQYVKNNKNQYFHMHLINKGFELFGESTSGLTYTNQTSLLYNYLVYERSLTNSYVSGLPYGTNEQTIINTAIQKISSGQPVILNVFSYTIGYHTVVAYDYDGTDIYVHSGWKNEEGSTLSRISLYDLYVDEVQSMVYIDNINNGLGQFQTVPRNYYFDFYGVDEYLDIQTIGYVDELELSFNEANINLTRLTWHSLFGEIWFLNPPTLSLSILDADDDSLIESCTVLGTTKTYQLSQTLISDLIDGNNNYDFKVRFDYYIEGYIQADVHIKRDFLISNLYNETITTGDFTVTNSYTSETINYIDAETNTEYDYKVKYKNVRKYGTNEFFIATKSNEINEGYLELYFPKGIDEISFWISFYSYSDYSIYRFNNSQCLFLLQEFKHGQYSNVIDFKERNNFVSSIRTDKTFKTIKFKETTFKIRIIGFSGPLDLNAGSTKTGRICIENICFKTNRYNCLPCNGYELSFNPMFGADYPGSNNYGNYNCYNYALNVQHNNYIYLQPGALSTDTQTYNSLYTNYFYKYYQEPGGSIVDKRFYVISTLAGYDSVANVNGLSLAQGGSGGISTNGYIFNEIDKDDIPADGCYKVALLFQTNGNDFHWLRQNSDGSWSHKLAGDKPINYDSLTNECKIYHPEDTIIGDVLTYDGSEGIEFFEVQLVKSVYSVFWI